jgi:hypothetical protein
LPAYEALFPREASLSVTKSVYWENNDADIPRGVFAQLLVIIGDDVHVMPIPAMPMRAAKFRCQSAADPVPAPPSSAVGRLGQIGFSGLITKEFLTLSEQFWRQSAIFRCRTAELHQRPRLYRAVVPGVIVGEPVRPTDEIDEQKKQQPMGHVLDSLG